MSEADDIREIQQRVADLKTRTHPQDPEYIDRLAELFAAYEMVVRAAVNSAAEKARTAEVTEAALMMLDGIRIRIASHWSEQDLDRFHAVLARRGRRPGERLAGAVAAAAGRRALPGAEGALAGWGWRRAILAGVWAVLAEPLTDDTADPLQPSRAAIAALEEWKLRYDSLHRREQRAAVNRRVHIRTAEEKVRMLREMLAGTLAYAAVSRAPTSGAVLPQSPDGTGGWILVSVPFHFPGAAHPRSTKSARRAAWRALRGPRGALADAVRSKLGYLGWAVQGGVQLRMRWPAECRAEMTLMIRRIQ